MPYQSDIYEGEKGKLFYKPTEGSDFAYIENPTKLQEIAKTGVLKVGAPRLKMPSTLMVGAPGGQAPIPQSGNGQQTPTSIPSPVSQAPGSNTAFNLAFSQLYAHGQKMQELQNQKNKLLKQLYDSPLTAEDLRTLTPSQQEAIRNGDKSLLEYQIMNINDTVKGRQDENSNALNYLFQGYKEDTTNAEKRRDESRQLLLGLAEKYGDLSGLTPEDWQSLQSGDITPELAQRLGKTIQQQRMQAEKPELREVDGNLYSLDFDKETGNWKSTMVQGKSPTSDGDFSGTFPTPSSVPQETFEEYLTKKEQESQQTFGQPKRDTMRKEWEGMQVQKQQAPTDLSRYSFAVQRVLQGFASPESLLTGGTAGERKRYQQEMDDAQKRGLLKTVRSEYQNKIIDSINTGISKNINYIKTVNMQGSMLNTISALSLATGPGDLAAINQFQKVIDEGAVTRDKDVELVNRSQSLVNAIKTKFRNLGTGEQLSPDLRKQIGKAVEALYNARAENLLSDPYVQSQINKTTANGMNIGDTIIGELGNLRSIDATDSSSDSYTSPTGKVFKLPNS